jgi:hypothetical protein
VALALSVGGVTLFGVVAYDFLRHLGRGPFSGNVVTRRSGLLLVFVFTELTGPLDSAT